MSISMLTETTKHSTVIDNIGVPTAVFASDNRIIAANRLFRQTFAFREGSVGRRFPGGAYRLIGGDERELGAVEFPGEFFDFRSPSVRNITLGVRIGDNDSISWYRITATPEHDGDGCLLEILVTFLDVTDLICSQNLQNQIGQAKKEWETTVDALQDIVTIQNRDMEIIRANKIAHEFFGYELGSLKHKKCYEVFSGLKYPCDGCPVPETVVSGRAHSGIICHKTADKTFKVSSFPIFDETGEVHQVVHVAEDVSQSLRDESEKNRLMEAIEQTSESVVMTDKSAIIEYVNPAFEEVTGYSRREVIGRNANILKSGEHDAEFYRGMWKTLLGKKVWRGRFRNQKKDGTLFVENVTISPILDRDGSIVNFVALKRDVTREVMLEQQLLHASKLEALGILAGGIAHDFNNILASMIGHGEIAKSKLKMGDPVYDDVQHILDGGDRAVDLIKQILTFSRREADGEFRVILLQHVIVEISEFLRPSLATTIHLKLDIDESCRSIYADPSQLYQVLMNLCNNSMQAIGDSHGEISIRLSEVDDREALPDKFLTAGCNGALLLEVRDTGCGIAKDRLPKIFDPFYTTKQKENGTGLGLSVVHGILKKHSAEITVESGDGGTVFKILFPLDCRMPEAKSAASEAGCGNERIMVVDDEPPVANVISAYLKKTGYQVVSYNDSIEAVRVFRQNPNCCDLVITDMFMPNMTGAELSREFLSLRKDLPIIMLTGHSENFDREKALRMGLKDYMLKPIKPKELNLAVRKGLDHGRDTHH